MQWKGIPMNYSTMERLNLFAEWTGTTPPEKVLDDGGAPTDQFLAYCRDNGLSLDWLFLGDERPLVMEAHRRARRIAA